MGTTEITASIISFIRQNWILLVAFAIVVAAVIATWLKKKKEKKAEISDIAVRETGNTRISRIVRIFKYPPLNKIYGKVHSRVVLYYPADDFSVETEVGALLKKGTYLFVAGIILTFLLGKGDLLFTCAGLLICFVAVSSVIDKRLDKMEELVMLQFRDALEKVRHHYRDVPIVDVALLKTINDLPFEISLHFKTLYDILTSTEIKLEMDKYIASSPNKFFTEFLSICASIKENGDKTLGNGNSVFIEDTNHLKDDISNFLLENRRRKNLFKGLSFIALAPVVAVKPFENWAKTRMPELGQYYNGIYGVVAMVTIFAIAYVVYKIIELLKDRDIVVERGENVYSRILDKVKPLDDFIANIINSNYVKYEKINDDLQAMGDYSGVRVYLFKKTMYFVGATLLTIGILFVSDISQKASYLHDFSSGFTDSVVPSDSYRDLMQETAESYANNKLYFSRTEAKVDSETLKNDILQHSEIKNETYAQEVADYVTKQMDKYYHTYFKFWYIFIALLIGFVTCHIPDLFMMVKKNVIENRKADEVMQFQSLMLVLMHMSGMTTEGILEWMERFSFCFREDIAECRINLRQGEQYALRKMQDQATYEPFVNFIDNLLAIDKCGVADAFSEIEADKNYNKEDRKEKMNERLESNANLAGIISFIPFATTAALCLVVPVIIYAANMMTELNQLF